MHIDISKMAPPSDNPVATAVETVHKITKTHPGPYYLLVSGGIDSQCMLWAWKQSGVPFKAVSMRYMSRDILEPLNMHDIGNLAEISKQFDVKVEFKDFYMLDFLEDRAELEEYAIKYSSNSPQILAYIKMTELIEGGTVLFSGNFGDGIMSYDTGVFGLHWFSKVRSVIPFFLSHDAEIAGSIGTIKYDPKEKLKVPAEYEGNLTETQRFIKNYRAGKYLRELGYPLVVPKAKFSGFEKVKDVYDTRPGLVTAIDRIKYSSMPSRRIFDLHFRYKLFDIISYKGSIVWKRNLAL